MTIILIERKLEVGQTTGVADQLNEVNLIINKYNGPEELAKLVRFKFSDVNHDYQLLFNTINRYRIFELVNKKIVLLASKEYSDIDIYFKNKLVMKTIDYLNVSNYDFRKLEMIKFVSNYIVDNALYLDLSPDTTKILTMFSTNLIIDNNAFESYLAQASTKIIHALDHRKLKENMVENNLVIVSTCYKSVYMSKLTALMGMEVLYDTLSRMIVSNNLPLNTKIDRVRGVLVFPEESVDTYGGVFNMVQQISNKLSV